MAAPLTDTERQALELREAGLSSDEIALRLNLLDGKSAENAVYRARKKIPPTICTSCGSRVRKRVA